MENNIRPLMKKKKNRTPHIAKLIGLILCFAFIAALTAHSLLSVFMDGYYPTFGKYRLFAIVTDSMEPEIPVGSVAVCAVPTSGDRIEAGAIITFEVKFGENTTLYTHRVTEVHVSDSGVISYTTKGDNAPAVDAFRPKSQNVVGVYIGKKCGFFGYVLGFLRSSEGAIALIITALIAVLALVVVRFVNLLNTWRRIAVDALAKSRGILANKRDEEVYTVADVLGIVSKDPADKAELDRLDKKLGRFLRTGTLPKRPYSMDLIDEDISPQFVGNIKEERGDAFEDAAAAERAATESTTEEKTVDADVKTGDGVAESIKKKDADVSPFFIAAAKASRKRSQAKPYALKLIMLEPRSKLWYASIKNELLSFAKMRTKLGKRCETFTMRGKAVARLGVRGKTLCLSLAVDPAAYEGAKYAVSAIKSSTPSLFKIKSKRKAEYALEQIKNMLSGEQKAEDFSPREYYISLDGIVAAK